MNFGENIYFQLYYPSPPLIIHNPLNLSYLKKSDGSKGIDLKKGKSVSKIEFRPDYSRTIKNSLKNICADSILINKIGYKDPKLLNYHCIEYIDRYYNCYKMYYDKLYENNFIKNKKGKRKHPWDFIKRKETVTKWEIKRPKKFTKEEKKIWKFKNKLKI